ncbi:hypothetical protein CPB86DRAFT_744149 [Serendipita vermifera]|nr:hypothetical protein CPB86DRAFT_744149 [Serendipita vermifera]
MTSQRQVTPKRRGTAPLHKSTPLNEASSSISHTRDFINQQLNRPTLRALNPWIRRDISNFKTAEFDRFLEYLLSLCRNPGEEAGDIDLGALYDTMVDICNNKKDHRVNFLRKTLEKYSYASEERHYYGPFITAGNTIYDILAGHEVTGFRPPSSMAVTFQQNDPKHIISKMKDYDEEAYRKPDVVLLSKIDANKIHPSSSVVMRNRKASKDIPYAPPADSRRRQAPGDRLIKWDQMKLAIEFKYKQKPKRLPQTYPKFCEKASSIPPQSLPKDEQWFIKNPGLVEGRKRPAAEPINPPTKRFKSEATSLTYAVDGTPDRDLRNVPEKWPPMVQLATYSAQMLSSRVLSFHAISMLIEDDVLWLWWYDRQGALQSHGINFLQDLPSLMVLLFAFQRLGEEEWGVGIDFPNESTGDFKFDDGTLVHFDTNEMKETWGITRRATCIIPCKVEGCGDTEFVLKVSQPETTRIAEHVILEEAHAIDDEDVKGHLPVFRTAQSLGHTTGRIRTALQIDCEKGPRQPRIIVMEKLDGPITKLEGFRFWKAVYDCFKCHLALWKHGIYHRDISSGNLMCKKVGEQVVGVLIDYDLATRARDGSLGNTDRTGTVPFMALDLISEQGLKQRVPHVYRHDAESFFWVLMWIVTQFEGGERKYHIHNSWGRQGFNESAKSRLAQLVRWHRYPGQVEVTSSFEIFEPPCLGPMIRTYNQINSMSQQETVDLGSNKFGELEEEEEETDYMVLLPKVWGQLDKRVAWLESTMPSK